MTMTKQKLTEASLLLLGILGSIFAYLDGQKGWVCLIIAAATLAIDEVLVRLRLSMGKHVIPPQTCCLPLPDGVHRANCPTFNR